MRIQLSLISIILPLIPYVVVFLYGDSTAKVISLVFMGLSVVIGVLGVIRGNPLAESLVSVVFISLVSILSSGYLVYSTHTYLLYINPIGLTILGYSIGFVELAIVSSMMLRMYNRLYGELTGKGYTEDEVKSELSEFTKNVITVSAIVLVISIIIYLLISSVTVSIIDPVTALVVFLIIYIILLRYVIRVNPAG
ncbi:hypothetical protein [Caldivirga maquilingensis]|uniref:Uncharacterized protein n=1 Tax=Caldivirga maquilingensis (strain ATCC 700844 / DSM 13496 / JCM 10307 / IC-167) TaxID=397948 RepID=A8MD89_CALMQ|nr:hypothetical protein [Caldivirga maquilingensis]ABW01745.1 hypothetical protein Cmaq_0912 [Caldivirga maquilingensis IC-167]